MISLVHHEALMVSVLGGGDGRPGLGQEGFPRRARVEGTAPASALWPALGVLCWGRGTPAEPHLPYLHGHNSGAVADSRGRSTTVGPRCLAQAPAHRAAKGCSPSCKHTRSTAQGHRAAEIAPSFQSLHISSPVGKPLLVLHSRAAASREGFL